MRKFRIDVATGGVWHADQRLEASRTVTTTPTRGRKQRRGRTQQFIQSEAASWLGLIHASAAHNPESVMIRTLLPVVATCLAVCLSSCSMDAPAPPVVVAAPPPPSGERLAYLVGCVNCHHQTPKEILNAPPLAMVKAYTLPEFRTLLKTGVTRDGRDMYAQGSIMGIVAREQLSHFSEDEVAAVHEFLQKSWTAERAAHEEAKIAKFPPPTFMKN